MPIFITCYFENYNIEIFKSLIYYYLALIGPLAQLVEQLTLNQRVKGSNPLGITK